MSTVRNYRLTLIFLVGVSLPFLFWLGAGSFTDSEPPFPREQYPVFDGIEWGASSSEILEHVQRYDTGSVSREAVFPQREPSGTKIMVRKVQKHGDTVDVGYVVHPERGLVKGFYFSRFDRGDDCRRVFDDYVSSIDEKVGKHKVADGENNQLDVPFCYSVLVGKAKKYSQWKTPEGLTITMVLGGENAKRRVRVFFETRAFYEWKKRVEGGGGFPGGSLFS